MEDMRKEFVGWSLAWLLLSQIWESGLLASLPTPLALKHRKPRSRQTMAKGPEIADYWSHRLSKLGVYEHEQGELHARECFACGDDRHVERCHIVPHAKGGLNEVWNLVLLCRRCHDESEHMPEPMFWRWMNNQRREIWEAPVNHAFRRLNVTGLAEMAVEAGIDVFDPVAVKEFVRMNLVGKKLAWG